MAITFAQIQELMFAQENFAILVDFLMQHAIHRSVENITAMDVLPAQTLMYLDTSMANVPRQLRLPTI